MSIQQVSAMRYCYVCRRRLKRYDHIVSTQQFSFVSVAEVFSYWNSRKLINSVYFLYSSLILFVDLSAIGCCSKPLCLFNHGLVALGRYFEKIKHSCNCNQDGK
jgi:hypothetical protein